MICDVGASHKACVRYVFLLKPANNGFPNKKTSPSTYIHESRPKVLVLSYEGEDLLVLALTSAKVPRRGSRKLIFHSRKFLCKGAGLLTGRWSDEPCVFTGSAGRMPGDQSWPGNAQPEGHRKNTPLQKQPPASRNRLVGVLKLAGPVECNFQLDFRECLA